MSNDKTIWRYKYYKYSINILKAQLTSPILNIHNLKNQFQHQNFWSRWTWWNGQHSFGSISGNVNELIHTKKLTDCVFFRISPTSKIWPSIYYADRHNEGKMLKNKLRMNPTCLSAVAAVSPWDYGITGRVPMTSTSFKVVRRSGADTLEPPAWLIKGVTWNKERWNRKDEDGPLTSLVSRIWLVYPTRGCRRVP